MPINNQMKSCYKQTLEANINPFKDMGDGIKSEKIIKQNSGIEEVVIIGQKHNVLGHTLKAFVKLNPQSTLKKSDILSFCIKNLEKHMVPLKIELVDDFPVTEYGKIKRFLLCSEALKK